MWGWGAHEKQLTPIKWSAIFHEKPQVLMDLRVQNSRIVRERYVKWWNWAVRDVCVFLNAVEVQLYLHKLYQLQLTLLEMVAPVIQVATWRWNKKSDLQKQMDTLPETNSSPLKMMVSNRNLLFQGSIFRGYVSFREGNGWSNFLWINPMTSCWLPWEAWVNELLSYLGRKLSDYQYTLP